MRLRRFYYLHVYIAVGIIEERGHEFERWMQKRMTQKELEKIKWGEMV